MGGGQGKSHWRKSSKTETTYIWKFHRLGLRTLQPRGWVGLSRLGVRTYLQLTFCSDAARHGGSCLNVIAHCTEEELCKWQTLRHQVASLWIRTKEAWLMNYHSNCTEFKCLNVIAHCTEEELCKLCKWQNLRHQVASLWIRTKRLDQSTITLAAQSLNV